MSDALKTQTRKTADTLGSLAGYHLRRASALVMNDFLASFADVPLRPVTFSILAAIGEQPGISSASLARQLGLQRANVAPLLSELEARDLIIRDDDESDRRAQRLTLTPTAQEALPGWHLRARLHEDRMFDGLTKKERTVLLQLLARLWQDEEDSRT